MDTGASPLTLQHLFHSSCAELPHLQNSVRGFLKPFTFLPLHIFHTSSTDYILFLYFLQESTMDDEFS